MKRIALYLLALIAVSCGSETVEKPNPLLKEEQMVDILYDLAVLQAYKSSNPKALTDNKIDSRNYIYKKYAIDSLVFAKNHQWYAAPAALLMASLYTDFSFPRGYGGRDRLPQHRSCHLKVLPITPACLRLSLQLGSILSGRLSFHNRHR